MTTLTQENMLIGWLCMVRHQWSNGIAEVVMPQFIADSLISKGWMTISTDNLQYITDEGVKVSDLSGPDWGIDSVNSDD